MAQMNNAHLVTAHMKNGAKKAQLAIHTEGILRGKNSDEQKKNCESKEKKIAKVRRWNDDLGGTWRQLRLDAMEPSPLSNGIVEYMFI
uniref:Uncharacterized protein n=1 Tax=Romanomermis culicivorax TaxID=13658 RepID=A0A915K849_ROMCU